MRLQHMFLRSVAQFSSKPPWIHRSCSSGNTDFSISGEVVSILAKAKPIEPALEPLVPFLSPKIIASVIKEQRNRQLGFRFFIWASKKERLRSRESLSLVIDMLSGEDGCDLYWQTLEELKNGGVSVNSYCFFVLISAYSKMGMTEKAVESFGRMKEFDCRPDVFTYNAILRVLKQKKVFLLALAVYNDMLKCNCSPNLFTFSIMMDILRKGSMMDDALKMFDEMTHRGILPNRVIYTIVFQGLCQIKRADEAHKLFHKMKEEEGSSPDSVAHNALLDGFCKLGKMDEAFELLQMFEKDGFVLDLRGHSSLIDGLFRAKRYAEAYSLYKKMLEKNIKPDVVLYTILIQGLSKAGQAKDALEMLHEMPRRGIVPDTYCYNAVIKGLCEVGLLEAARSLKLEISENDCFPDACTYTILICSMCRNGLDSKAEEIFNEMEQKGCHPSVFTFNALIDGLCKSRKLNKALRLFHKMEVEVGKHPSLFLRLSYGGNLGHDRSSINSMVEQYCESGLILKAYRILEQLAETRNPDIVTYNILINEYCKSGNIDGALKLIQELKGKGLFPDSVTYGTLINGLQRVGREEDAFVLFHKNSGIIQSPEIYRSLMTWSCRRKKISVAFNLWLKYLRETTRVDDEEVKEIEQCFEEGDLEKAAKGLIRLDIGLKELGLGPYTIWLIGLCQSGKFKEAMEVFSFLRERKIIVTAPSCVKLIHGLCKRGELDTAVEVFSYTLENGFKLMPRVCDYLLRSLLLCEDKKELAFELMNRMRVAGYDVKSMIRARTRQVWLDCRGKRVKSHASYGHEDTAEMENASPG
ncbi:PREDICTED: pentatricopeptide repeat-containing protein At1g79540 [Tarenaya hassleriana]|uniref:pentatricopeptide repeat-containing protein At1g79540 n=1 Tax=Tarenaya hassleriana TaxID=28532 RepID=UPI00053C4E77|nr:PREDICTED: pentatricopeptide repeat-containing protein At1g79540 [Tarenaya hassleriana]